MDPGTIIAVVETSSRVLTLIAKYYSGVKKAKEDIEGLKTEVEAFHNVLREIQVLVQSSTKLPSLSSLTTAIEDSSTEIGNIEKKLDSSLGKKAMSRVGFRALRWPFAKKEVEEHITRLEGHKTTLTLALSSVQTSLILGIDGNVSQLRRGQSRLQQDQNFAEQDRQLCKLLVADGAAFDSYYRQHEPQCVKKTRVDLLRQVQTWAGLTDNDQCIFWLNGMAGTGKSTIARTVACTFADQKRLGASFFFSRGAGDLGHATKFVSTLAGQLASLSPLFKQHISEAIADHDNITRQGLHNQWKELILKPLSKRTGPIVTLIFVIDALDECEREEDIKLILQLFVEAKSLITVKLKIFLTSRPETPIRLGFKKMPEILHQDLILHEISRSIVEHDICVFLKHELDKIREDRNLPDDWPHDRKINLLITRSDCLFIYIATACRFICDSNWPPQERLSLILEGDNSGLQPTAELDGMYMQILKLSIIKISGIRDKSRLSERFRHVIGSIVTLFDMLSTIALACLLNISVEDINLTLDSLHSVLQVPRDQKQPLRLLHPSFRDFLVNSERCNDSHFYIDQELVHMELARSCLELLFHTLKRDMCNLRMPGTLIHEVQCSQIDNHLSKDVQYACRYWVDHLERIGHEGRFKIGFHDDGQIHVFLLKHILHWLEALCLMGKVSEGLLMITRLEAMLEPSEHSALKAIVYDGKRFVLSNRSIIEEAPLQLYASALVFCPKQSVIKTSYINELPTWITRYPEVEENWGSLLQVLEGHTCFINAVVFSGDSKLLASASWDYTIRLWDSATGTLRSTLEGHKDDVTAVAFSSDSQLLASASSDQTVRLWDPATGMLLSTLEGHTDRINAVAFSSDGQLLASASDDSTVRLWNVAKGNLQSVLEGHTDKITVVAFSGDCQLLASASGDRTVRLWNPTTGALQSTLEGHTDMITAVAFSGNSQILASASEDRMVRLWDPATGTLQSTLEGHTDWINAVAFSSDGQLLASASDDSTVRLWNVAKRNLQSVLEGHTGEITGVAFSGDCQLLASASYDQTVRLWNPATGTLQSKLEGHTDWIEAVAFSGNSQLLASASFDQTVRLWDPAKKSVRSALEDHKEKISTVTFSGDSQLLASASWDQTVRLWDPATGRLQRTLEGHTGRITAVVFSGDSQLLASVSMDRTIGLWDVATGTLRSMLEGHTDNITEVVFSGDGQLLASASIDHTIRLWDPLTGTLRSTLESHTDWIAEVVFSGNGQLLASASGDHTIRLWDPTTGTLRSTLEGHKHIVWMVAFSDDSQILASASEDQTIRLWDPEKGTLRSTLEGHTAGVAAVAFSRDGQLLASASRDRWLLLWDPLTGNLIRQFEADGIRELSFSPDQTHLETNLGRIQLSNINGPDNTSGQPVLSGSWMVQGNWLTWNQHKALWLPPDFRHHRYFRDFRDFRDCCLAIRGNLIVIGHFSRRVIFLGLQSSFNGRFYAKVDPRLQSRSRNASNT